MSAPTLARQSTPVTQTAAPATHRWKILHMIESSSAGSARYAADLLLNIDTSRFDVTFVYSPYRADARFWSDLKLIQARGIRVVEIPMARSIDPKMDLAAFAKVFRLMRRSKFDLVHLHSSKAGFLGRFAAKLARRKTVTVYCPHAIAISIHKIFGYLEKLAGHFTDAMVAVSESEQQQLAEFGLVPESRIRRVTAAIDVFGYNKPVDRGGVRQQYGIPEDAIVVATAGRLAAQKDPLSYLQAAQIIAESNPNVYFIWMGDGELGGEIRRKVIGTGLSDRILFPGYSPNIQPVLAAADIFVLSSIYESFGYVTCEAMALGKPVVGTDVAGTQELVQDGTTGLLVPPRDPAALAEALQKLISFPSLRQSMGSAGRKRAEVHFDLSRMIKETEELYLRLLRSV